MDEFYVMYENTGGVRLDSVAPNDPDGTFPRSWIDCYRYGNGVNIGMSDHNGTQVGFKLTSENALALGFGLLRAGLGPNLRTRINEIYKMITGDDPRG